MKFLSECPNGLSLRGERRGGEERGRNKRGEERGRNEGGRGRGERRGSGEKRGEEELLQYLLLDYYLPFPPAPQPGQNFAPGAFLVPHWGQKVSVVC